MVFQNMAKFWHKSFAKNFGKFLENSEFWQYFVPSANPYRKLRTNMMTGQKAVNSCHYLTS